MEPISEDDARALVDRYRAAYPPLVAHWKDLRPDPRELGTWLHWNLMVMNLCGYSPQLLIADKRTPLRKWSDEHGGYDALIRQIGEQTRKDLAAGGTFKPFPYQESMMAAITGGNEFVVSTTGRHRSPYAYPEMHDFPPLGRRREPTFHTVTMFPRVQPLKLKIDVYDRISPQLKQIELLSRFRQAEIESKLLRIALGVFIESPVPLRRLRRLERLCMSGDRRKRKRGYRLALKELGWRL